MSSSEPRLSRRLAALALVGGLSLTLGGCFRPLYGELSSGRSMQDELAAIEVVQIDDRMGHYLRTELMFLLDGSGGSAPKRYRLNIVPTLNVATAIVDTAAARADAATLTGSADFTLTAIADGQQIFKGKATGSATYERSVQRFATVRAARDAEIRLGKLLAEQIRTRIAAALAARSV